MKITQKIYKFVYKDLLEECEFGIDRLYRTIENTSDWKMNAAYFSQIHVYEDVIRFIKTKTGEL